jgi:chitin disaccharide deacetylase
MVSGPAAADAVRRARRLGDLHTGLHIVLVDGRPTLSPEQVPDLVNTGGCFRTDMACLGADIFFRPTVRRQVRAEIVAQFEAFRATGLRLDHVNLHKHFHLHPTIGNAVIAIGRHYGMNAVRVPSEPLSILAKVESLGQRHGALLTKPWASLLGRRARRAGLRVPDYVFGLVWSGAMTEARLAGVIKHLPEGCSEIYLHPATCDDFVGHAPGYRYTDELAALLSSSIARAVRTSGLLLGGFGSL